MIVSGTVFKILKWGDLMKRVQVLLSFFVFGSLGCANLGDKFTQVEDFNKSKALVYVYRVPKFAGSAGSPYLCIDGKVAGEVADGGYFSLLLDPGSHKVNLKSLGTETEGFTFKVGSGKTYYLRSDFSSLKSGTGAGLVGDAIWATSSDEQKKILDSLDKSAQELTTDASLLFVNEGFAKNEIVKTKLFKVPQYEKNYCAKSEKKMKPKRR